MTGATAKMPFAGHGEDAEGLWYIDVMNRFALVSTGFNDLGRR
ncbi:MULTISPECIES: hypothetical protein [unclassified Mesorhizobium]|nr:MULTISPECIES: hypothetical protein [unclassified Mesorhizobium]MDG4889296.1 hypothetical protein [Mesorhizobium sp. WSM4887]